ncbi:MAG: hypothetical protein GQ573_08440 [Gammaproteobacteria bacterium]|nr:hypothetical protein [Gammaproteobacteria bacterium]
MQAKIKLLIDQNLICQSKTKKYFTTETQSYNYSPRSSRRTRRWNFALVPMLCVGTHTYDCLSTICVTTQERGNEEITIHHEVHEEHEDGI